MQSLEQLAQVYPGNPMPLIMQGDILREQKHFQEAVTAYTRAIADIGTPGQADWGVFYSRGIAYDMAHDWPKAQADFQQALHLAPDQPAVLNYLGYTWTDRGQDLKQARADDRESTAATAGRRGDHRQSGLGDAAPGSNPGGG